MGKQGKRVSKANLRKKVDQNAMRHNYQDAFVDQEKLKWEKFPARRTEPKSNDPQWYFKSAETLRDVASFSFSKPLGTSVLTSIPAQASADTFISACNAVPGLMALTLAPTIGVAIDAASPINIAAQNIYTRVRYKNSGAANYDAPDLMMYYVAMSSLYSAWNWAKRIYGYASMYSQTNWYKPAAYAYAENVDLDDIVVNLSDYRGRLNIIADKINAFCVPSVFSYMIRHSWMYANIYKDSETNKAQEYMFTPSHFYQYDETSSDQGSILVPVDINLTRPGYVKQWTAMKILDVLNGMVNALQYSSDIGNMSGDTLKEFGNNLFRLSYIEADYRVDAVYNKEVLTQFENAIFLASWDSRRGTVNVKNVWTIRHDPNTNFIKFQPKYAMEEQDTPWLQRQLNFHWNSPTPEDVMVASRLNVNFEYSGTGIDRTQTIIDCGSEIALRCGVIYYTVSDNIQSPWTPTSKMVLNRRNLATLYFGDTSMSGPNNYANLLSRVLQCGKDVYLWTAFDWAPQLYMATVDHSATAGTNSKYYYLPSLRDWDVYATLDLFDYQALNLLALQSLFNVPN